MKKKKRDSNSNERNYGKREERPPDQNHSQKLCKTINTQCKNLNVGAINKSNDWRFSFITFSEINVH